MVQSTVTVLAKLKERPALATCGASLRPGCGFGTTRTFLLLLLLSQAETLNRSPRTQSPSIQWWLVLFSLAKPLACNLLWLLWNSVVDPSHIVQPLYDAHGFLIQFPALVAPCGRLFWKNLSKYRTSEINARENNAGLTLMKAQLHEAEKESFLTRKQY